ncbi:MAG TPA: hypothetical protein VFJ02_23085, partial [Vicinamibacterales bacterium]|nr:hypothetical protein [Vicinamibacterales bacterium]
MIASHRARFAAHTVAAALFVVSLAASSAPRSSTASISPIQDPLPSWNDGPAKTGIVGFVGRVIREGSADFVPPSERIAVFDNDGTLWSEQPIYVQLAFALDRVRALAPSHPEWRTTQPFKGVLDGDMKAVAASGERGLLEIVAATHVGNTTDEFAKIVNDWISSARHPKTGRPYTDMVF